MHEDRRLEGVLEQVHADERLTADLSDEGAVAVLRWIEDELRAAAHLDDRLLDARAGELRRAVKQVARANAGDPGALIAAARAILPPIAAPPGAHASVRPVASWRRVTSLSRPKRRRRAWSR